MGINPFWEVLVFALTPVSGLVDGTAFPTLLWIVSPDSGKTLAVMEGATLLAAEFVPVASKGAVVCEAVAPSPMVCV